jgi:hypothetical protein
MIVKRPLSLCIAAWAILVIHSIGGFSGAAALLFPSAFVPTPYPKLLDLAFVTVNGIAVFAGVALLQMRRVGAWTYGLVVVPAFLLLSFFAEQQFSIGTARYIGGIIMFALFAALSLPHWSKLAPVKQNSELATNA